MRNLFKWNEIEYANMEFKDGVLEGSKYPKR